MPIKKIFCQDAAIGLLQRAMTAGKLPHAYIFAGPDGVGKLTTAKEWAKVLLCKNRLVQESQSVAFHDSCGACESCTAFDADAHPDFNLVYKELIEYTRDGKAKKTPVFLPIDVIREFVIEKAARRPQLSESTVFVVCEAEKLKAPAQNALLKVLEEPPGFCFIILLCTRLEKLLPTTLSRCQIVRFGPVDEQKLVEKLAESGTAKAEALFWARFTEGSLGQAMTWAHLAATEQSCYEIKKQMIKRLAEYELADAVDFADWILNQSRQVTDAWAKHANQLSKADIRRTVQTGIVRMIITAFQDAMKLNAQAGQKLINSDQRKEIGVLAGRFGPEQAAEQIRQAYKSIVWIEAGVNEKLVFEQLLLNCADSGIMLDA